MTANPDHEEMDETFVSYSFDWKALQEFLEHCQHSNSAIDKFCLMLMRRRMVGMPTSTEAKLMLTDYRNCNRDNWLQHQQRELKYQHYLMQHHLIQGGNQEHLDEVDTCSERLTRASMDRILKQLKHDCLQLREYHNASARMKFNLLIVQPMVVVQVHLTWSHLFFRKKLLTPSYAMFQQMTCTWLPFPSKNCYPGMRPSTTLQIAQTTLLLRTKN